MDLTYNYSYRRYKKYFFNKYFLYIFLGVLIFVNILIFPELLNHKDIKLNDMSYIVSQNINNVTKSNNIETTPLTEIISENDPKLTNLTQNPFTEPIKTQNVTEDPNSNSIIYSGSNEQTNLEHPKNIEEKHKKTDQVIIERIPTEKNQDVNQENSLTNEGNKNLGKDREVIINGEIEKQVTFKSSERNSNLSILFIILIALFISLGFFVFNNLDTIKLAFKTSKGHTIRDYIYPGYELLRD